MSFACQVNQSFVSAPTDIVGSYSLLLPTSALPCIASVTLTSGEVLRAIVVTGSPVANVTPLTEVVVRRAGANPANYQQATSDTLLQLVTMQVQFNGDPTTTPFVPNGTGNDAALLQIFPPFSNPLTNSQSTKLYGSNIDSLLRVDPSIYPAVMPSVEDPLWDEVKLGFEKTLNDYFWGAGGYLDDKLSKPDKVAVEKLTKYAMAVMLKTIAKKGLARCIQAGCTQKMVLGLADQFKSNALATPATLLKDLTSTPVELIATTVFDSVADYLEANAAEQLTSDGQLGVVDAIELGTVVYFGRVSGHVIITELVGQAHPLNRLGPAGVVLKAEMQVGFDYASKDIVNVLYIAKLKYDASKENDLTALQAQIFLARRDFRTDAASAYSAWLLTDRSQDFMIDLNAKAAATKGLIKPIIDKLPATERAIQTNLSNNFISKVLASYEKLAPPKITKIEQSVISPYVATQISISGVNLPSTATISITDGILQGITVTPTRISATVVLPSGYSTISVVDRGTTIGSIVVDVWTPSDVVTSSTPLTDTGATMCFTDAANLDLAACNSASASQLSATQDAMLGRDATGSTNVDSDGILGLSYAKLPNGCVQDNVTGLVWETKTDSDTSLLTDWRRTFTYESDGRAGSVSEYVNRQNQVGLCGFSDWRLPTFQELASIYIFNGRAQYELSIPLDTRYFPFVGGAANITPRTDGQYITSHFIAGAIPSFSSFRDWQPGGYTTHSTSKFLTRLVRGGVAPSQITTKYQYSGSEVTDPVTGLVWQRCAVGMSWDGVTCTGTATKMTLRQAFEFAKNAASGGTTWRVPNVKELLSIVDADRTTPAINSTAFPSTPAAFFFSSTPCSGMTPFVVGIKSCVQSVGFSTPATEFHGGDAIVPPMDYLRLVR